MNNMFLVIYIAMVEYMWHVGHSVCASCILFLAVLYPGSDQPHHTVALCQLLMMLQTALPREDYYTRIYTSNL